MLRNGTAIVQPTGEMLPMSIPDSTHCEVTDRNLLAISSRNFLYILTLDGLKVCSAVQLPEMVDLVSYCYETDRFFIVCVNGDVFAVGNSMPLL